MHATCWQLTHNKWQNFAFHILIPTYVYLKNEIYQKMQREKLHNLHKTATFTVALFVLKIDKILNDQISTLQKLRFFLYRTNASFSYLSSNMFYLEKTKYTTRCSVKNSTICKERFIWYIQLLLLRKSKTLNDQFSRLQKFYTNEDFLFSYFIFLSPHTFFFKKTEYDERCSVKSSTICEQQFILIVSFVFSKKSKILWTIFRNVENWSLRILFILKQKVHN